MIPMGYRKAIGPGRRSSGIALTEAVICLPILLLLVQGVFHFGIGYINKQNTVVAARYMAWRTMHEQDSLISSDEYQERFEKNFPLTGSARYEVQDSSAGTIGTAAIVTASTFILSTMGNPFALTPALFAANLWSAGDDTKEVTVVSDYSPGFLPWLPASSLTAKLKVTGSTWTKEDLGGASLFTTLELEMALYEYELLD